MKLAHNLIVFLLLCIQQRCMSIPVDSTGKELIYSYSGLIEASSSASDDRIGRWNLTGKLTTQTVDRNLVFQLHDLQTTIFNGLREDLNYSQPGEIPKEAEGLKTPFVFNRDSFYLFVLPEEPLWSINLKRSIATNFLTPVEGKNWEPSIYGNCEVTTVLKENKVIKTINHDTCEKKPYKHKTNVRPAPKPDGFSPVQRKTTVVIESDGESIHSVSNLTYQAMPKAKFNQELNQFQELDLISKSTDFKKINTDQLTKKVKIVFEFDNDQSYGRSKQETNSKVFIDYFMKNYEEFEKDFEQTPIDHHRISTEDHVENMFQALYDMPDVKGLETLLDEVDNKTNWEMYSTYVSLLPYIGTNNSVNYLNKLIANKYLDSSPYHMLITLATFPNYINEPTTELVETFADVMKVEDVELDNIEMGKILSFGSIVARSVNQRYLTEKAFKKYQKMYYDKFIGSELYENKMAYLLGLINMADGHDKQFILSIIKDKSLHNNLRSLAITGFKNELLAIYTPEELFDDFWPIVQNKKENFDIRVCVLDLLLSARLTEKDFNTILQEFKKKGSNIYEKHLANYFISTLESLQNSTGYKDPIGDLATATLQNEHFSIFSRAWQTGNYRLSYTDAEPNIGEYIQAKVIANPKLNTPSIVQLSYNNFAWSFDTGVYTIYLKLQGAFEYFYKDHFLAAVRNDNTIPELLELIKEFDFKMKKLEQDYHIEIVVFIDDKAVYASHLSNKKKMKQFSINIKQILDDFMHNYFAISFPIMDYTQIPSLLGTPINIMNDMQQITNFAYDPRYDRSRNDLLYRSSWSYQTWLESYNPILDTTVASYKYYGDEKGLRTKFSGSTRELRASWINKNNTFNWAWDNLIGTTVDDEQVLTQYCPGEVCEPVNEVPTGLWSTNYTRDHDNFGVRLNTTKEAHSIDFDGNEPHILDVFAEAHHSNAYAFPYAKPLLVHRHFLKHFQYFQQEIERTKYQTLEICDGGSETRINLDWTTKMPGVTMDPFKDRHNNYSFYWTNIEIESKKRAHVLNDWMYFYQTISNHNFTDENGKEKIKMEENFYYIEDTTYGKGLHICASRVELQPAIRSDKLNIEAPEDTTAVHIIRRDPRELNDTVWKTCTDNHTLTLNEVYTISEERLKKVKESPEYQTCREESKGLSFTPPTRSCVKSFVAANQYDQYTVRAQEHDMPSINGEDLKENPLLTIFREGEDKIKFSILKSAFSALVEIDDTEKFKEFIIYYPYIGRSPTIESYDEYDIFRGFKRTCTITPKTIRSFIGENNQHDGKKQVAFVECLKQTKRGLTFEKISDHHVAFKLWSQNNIVEATVHDGQIKVTFNSEEINESYLEEDSETWVRFLDKNVILITDEKLSVYYNTEFIQVKVTPIYNNLICGLCSSD